MHVSIIKEERFDRLDLIRADGSTAVSRFPKKGPVPHDAVHYHVESGLGLHHAFWGLVASGHHPEDVSALAKASGHASAKRADVPDNRIIELLQAERIVECFEANLWGGGADPDAIRAMAQTGCERAHVPLPDLNDADICRIMSQISALNVEWSDAPLGHSVSFEWPEQ